MRWSITATVNVVTDEAIYLTEVSGDLALLKAAGDLTAGRIIAEGDVVLTVLDGSILSANNDDTADIAGGAMTLDAANGSIGAAGSSLEIDSGDAGSGGVVNGSASGLVNLTEMTGDLAVGLIATAAGDVELTALNGSIVDGHSGAGDGEEQPRSFVVTVDSINPNPDSGPDYVVVTSPDYVFETGDEVVYNGKENIRLEQGATYTIEVLADNDAADDEYRIAFVKDGGRYWSLRDSNGEHTLTVTVNDAPGDGIDPEQDDTHVDVSGQNITLHSATGSIGAYGWALEIDADGVVNASAFNSVYVTETSGDLVVGLIEATVGDVELNVISGSILAATSDAASRVEGDDITLHSATGSIGAYGRALEIDSDGVINASAFNSVYVTETSGDLLVGQIVSEVFDVELTAISGSILAATSDATSSVDGDNITLHAAAGAIGTDGNALGINLDGTLQVEMNGPIYVRAAAGDLRIEKAAGDLIVGEITALSGNVDLETYSGSILSATSGDGIADIRGNVITLNAGGGSIGEDGHLLEIDSGDGRRVYVKTPNAIYLREMTGDLNIEMMDYSELIVGDIQAPGQITYYPEDIVLRPASEGESTDDHLAAGSAKHALIEDPAGGKQLRDDMPAEWQAEQTRTDCAISLAEYCDAPESSGLSQADISDVISYMKQGDMLVNLTATPGDDPERAAPTYSRYVFDDLSGELLDMEVPTPSLEASEIGGLEDHDGIVWLS